ncbi:hypothetical protein U9M48_039347 [Paspalum notatum var. saurae]|uniref:Uncharacterized protein n=1 Tax=Paspalum notatum var. saurae TaxID=547442 RepID=A0AAQ3UJG2_PASNO
MGTPSCCSTCAPPPSSTATIEAPSPSPPPTPQPPPRRCEEDYDAFTSTKAQPLVDAQIPFKIHLVRDDHGQPWVQGLTEGQQGQALERPAGDAARAVDELHTLPEDMPICHDASEVQKGLFEDSIFFPTKYSMLSFCWQGEPDLDEDNPSTSVQIAFTNEADGSMINSLQMKLLLSFYIEQMSST